MALINYSTFDLDDQHVFDINQGGVMFEGNPAVVGGPVDALVSLDGTITATVLPGSNFTLQYSVFRPDVLVLAGNGGFFLDSVAAQAGSGFEAWSFAGAITEMGVNGVIAMQQLAGGGSTTNGQGIGLRANWTNDGFTGDDSSIRPMTPNGGTVGGNTSGDSGYLLGAQNQWHNFVVGNDGTDVLGFMPQEITFDNVSGFTLNVNRPEFIFGGATRWNGTTFVPGLDVEIAQFGVWTSLPDFAALQNLSEAMNAPSSLASRNIVWYGDSRSTSQPALGVAQRFNRFGYHIHRRVDSGWQIADIDTALDADIAEGRKFEACFVWIASNNIDPSPGADNSGIFAELVAWVDKFLSNEVAPKIHLCVETPRGNDIDNPASYTPQAQLDLYNLSMAIQRLFEGNQKVIVVDSWSAVVDPRNHLWVDPRLSNDGTHFIMGNNEGNERIFGKLMMPLIQEELEDIEPIVTVRNARSLDARRQSDIERTQQTILAAIEEQEPATESQVEDVLTTLQWLIEDLPTLEDMDDVAIQALTDYNVATGTQVIDTLTTLQGLISALPTLTAFVQSAAIVALTESANANGEALEALSDDVSKIPRYDEKQKVGEQEFTIKRGEEEV